MNTRFPADGLRRPPPVDCPAISPQPIPSIERTGWPPLSENPFYRSRSSDAGPWFKHGPPDACDRR